MSTSYKPYVVFGFKCEQQEIYIDKTKFNENTGLPYNAQEYSHTILSVDGKEIDNSGDYGCGETIKGFKLFNGGMSSEGSNELVLGIQLAGGEDMNYCDAIEELSGLKEDSVEKLQEISPSTELKYFLVCYVG